MSAALIRGMLIAAIAGLTSASSSAYELLGSRWPGLTTTLHAAFSRDGGFAPSGRSWNDAFAEAAAKWNHASAFKLEIADDFSHPCENVHGLPPNRGRNGVGFHGSHCAEAFGAGTLAVTTTWTRAGVTVESDIVFNDRIAWDVYAGPWRSEVADFHRVALHELGHVLGLAHGANHAAVMAPIIAPGDGKETLEQDDTAGVVALYGPPPTTPALLPTVIWLEEPSPGEVKTGVSNLRGWIASQTPISTIELQIDDRPPTAVPFAANRPDVTNNFPAYPASNVAGFSLAMNYSNLAAGPHRVHVRATDTGGHLAEAQADFAVVRFVNPFVKDTEAVRLDRAVISYDAHAIHIEHLLVEGIAYDVRLSWQAATQSYEITEIKPADTE